MRTIIGIAILVLLSVAIFVSCRSRSSKVEEELKKHKPYNSNGVGAVETGTWEVFVIDGCQYIAWNNNGAGGIIHKENCRNVSMHGSTREESDNESVSSSQFAKQP